MGIAIGLGTGPDRAVWSALPKTRTTARATFVGDTPGMVGYGGKVTVGSDGVVFVVTFAAATLTIGADVVAAVVDAVVSAAALIVSADAVGLAAVCPAVTGSSAGVADCSVAVVEDFCLLPVAEVFSVVEVVAPEPVWVELFGVDCPAVDPVVVCVDPEVVPGDVVPNVSSFVCVLPLDDDEP
jgi:hypothetical protein